MYYISLLKVYCIKMFIYTIISPNTNGVFFRQAPLNSMLSGPRGFGSPVFEV